MDQTKTPTPQYAPAISPPDTTPPRPRPLLPTDADRLGDEIAEMSAHLDAATHRLLTLIRAFDEGVGWNAHGALSCAHWLCWRMGLDLGAARERVRVARALGALPRIDDALRHGRVSYSKVRALTRVATSDTESSLLEMARSSTASQLERICRGYRTAVRGLLGTHPEDEAELRWVRERETESGMVRIDAQLTPEEAAVVRRAIDLAMKRAREARAVSADVSAETAAKASKKGNEVPPTLRRADALVAVAEGYLSHPSHSDTAPPVEVVLHVDADALRDRTSEVSGTLDDGAPLPRSTTERLACDASIVRVVKDARGNPLAISRRQRTISTTLRRALRLRDRGCRFPSCTNRHVDGHHVVPWSRGGETQLTNLLSLCRRQHRFVHEYGFRVEASGEGGFTFHRPNGAALSPSPAAPTLASNPVRALLDRHRAANLAIDAETGFPNWDGRAPDYDHIVGVLVATTPTPGNRAPGSPG